MKQEIVDVQHLLSNWQYCDALSQCDLLLAESPKKVPVLANRARALSQMGRLSDAAEAYDSFADDRPASSPVHFTRGRLLCRLKLWEEAGNAFHRGEPSPKRAIELATLSILSDDIEHGEVQFSELLENKELGPDAYLARAESYLKAGHRRLAAAGFAATIGRFPDCRAAYLGLLNCDGENRLFQQLSALSKAAPESLRDNSGFVFRFLCRLWWQLGNFKQILSACQNQSLEEADHSTWATKALFCVQLQDFGAAQKTIDEGLTRFPGSPPLLKSQLRLQAETNSPTFGEFLEKVTKQLGHQWAMQMLSTLPHWLLKAGNRNAVVEWLTKGPESISETAASRALEGRMHSADPVLVEPLAEYFAGIDKPVQSLIGACLETRLQHLKFANGKVKEPTEPLRQTDHQLDRKFQKASAALTPEFSPLVRQLQILDRVTSAADQAWMHCGESYLVANAMVDWLVSRIAKKLPTSVIRLGDGEGRFLPERGISSSQRLTDQQRIQKATWWGEVLFSDDDSAAFSDYLYKILHSADLLGIPQRLRLLQEFGTERGGATISTRGIASISANLEYLLDRGQVPKRIASCNLHADLHNWGLYDRLFDNIDRVSIIGSHDVSRVLADDFGTTVRTHHRIPGEHRWRGLFREEVSDGIPIFPDTFVSLTDALAPEPGEVYLVGAGFLGKFWCHVIKRRGGIAIDVGSQMDRWNSGVTRPY